MGYKKRVILIFVTAIIVGAVLYSSIYDRQNYQSNYLQKISCSDPEPFYLGVTYGGDSVEDAKQLIDKIKGYTNLIVIQSGQWEMQPTKLNEVCGYAVSQGLNFIVYFGHQHSSFLRDWLRSFNSSWQNNFLGVYFGDEIGGKMLDSNVWLKSPQYPNLNKYANGSISFFSKEIGSTMMFQQDKSIMLTKHTVNESVGMFRYTTYNPDGSIVTEVQEGNQPCFQVANDDLPKWTYVDLLNQQPFKTYDEAADIFVHTYSSNINSSLPNMPWNITYFLSDYALYWYDYQGGYDVVFAQLGWNNTLNQEIGLVRGAANLQDKDWGTIITWKYTQSPYLTSGDEMYEQMLTSYKCGAKYVVVFNYADDMDGPYGTLEEEHFQALERFWHNVVKYPSVKYGGIEAEAAFVLPKDFGWGMRRADDTIWGLWAGNSTTEQIWNQLQVRLEQYGSKLDIVYDDTTYPVLGKYSEIYYWNQ